MGAESVCDVLLLGSVPVVGFQITLSCAAALTGVFLTLADESDEIARGTTATNPMEYRAETHRPRSARADQAPAIDPA